MSLELLTYLLTLTVVYLYPNSRGSVGLFWASGFVLSHGLLTWIVPGHFLLLTLGVGLVISALFLTVSRLALDPFADATVFQFAVGIVERLSKGLSLVGIAPKSSLLDAHDNTRVRRVYAQLEAQHWSTAEAQIMKLPDGERYQLVSGLADVARRPDIFNDWTRDNHRSPLAWCVSGQQRISAAWEARGAGLAHTVTARGMSRFASEMKVARADLRNAISLNNTLCDPYVGLLTIAMTEAEDRKKLWDLFARIKVLSDEHYTAHVTMTTALTVKWGGSPDEALEFARVTIRNAPDTSALVGVLAVAHIEYWLQLDIDEREYESEMYFRTSSVLEELKKAYARLETVTDLSCEKIQALNAFAFCFFKGGQFELVRAIVARLQGEYVVYPWQYCVEPMMATFNTAYAIDHVINKISQNADDSADPALV